MHKFSRLSLLAGALALSGGLVACGDDVTVSPPPTVTPTVHTVTVNPSSATVPAGGVQQFSATVAADSGVSRTVTWSVTSSTANVFTIDQTGRLTVAAAAPNGATAVVHAVAGNVEGTASVSVTRGVTGILVTPGTVTVDTGKAQILGVTLQAAPGVSRRVTCTSSNPAIVSVTRGVAAGDTLGCVVTGVAPGNATVTVASTADPTVSQSVGVTVNLPTLPVIATISIQSITQGGTIFPVNISNVSNQIDVTFNVEPGGERISRVDLLVDNTVCASQTFSATDKSPETNPFIRAALQAAPVTLSCRTDFFNATNGAVTFLNGQHTISGRLTTSTGATRASNTVGLNFNNSSGFFISSMTTVPNVLSAISPNAQGEVTATDSRGLVWRQGNIRVSGFFVAYGGETLANAQIAFGFDFTPPPAGVTPALGNIAGNEGRLITVPLTLSGNAFTNQIITLPQGDDCRSQRINGIVQNTAFPDVPVVGNAAGAPPADVVTTAAGLNGVATPALPGGGNFANSNPDGPQQTCGYQTPPQAISVQSVPGLPLTTQVNIFPEFVGIVNATTTAGNTVVFNSGSLPNALFGILNRADLPSRLAGVLFNSGVPVGSLPPNLGFPACTPNTLGGSVAQCTQVQGVRIDNVNPAAAGNANALIPGSTYAGPNPSFDLTARGFGPAGFRNAWISGCTSSIAVCSATGNNTPTSFSSFLGAVADYGSGFGVGGAVTTQFRATAVQDPATGLNPSNATAIACLNTLTSPTAAARTTSCLVSTGADLPESILNTAFVADAEPIDALGNRNQICLATVTGTAPTSACLATSSTGVVSLATGFRFGVDKTPPAMTNTTGSVADRTISGTATGLFFGVDVKDSLSGFNAVANNGATQNGAGFNGSLTAQYSRHAPGVASQTTPQCLVATTGAATTGSTAGTAQNCTFTTVPITGGVTAANFQSSAAVPVTDGLGAAAPGYYRFTPRICDRAGICNQPLAEKAVAIDPNPPVIVGVVSQGTQVAASAAATYQLTVTSQDDLEVIGATAAIVYTTAGGAVAHVQRYPFFDVADVSIPAHGASPQYPGEAALQAGNTAIVTNPGTTAPGVGGPYAGILALPPITDNLSGRQAARFDFFLTTPIQTTLTIPNFYLGVENLANGNTAPNGAATGPAGFPGQTSAGTPDPNSNVGGNNVLASIQAGNYLCNNGATACPAAPINSVLSFPTSYEVNTEDVFGAPSLPGQNLGGGNGLQNPTRDVILSQTLPAACTPFATFYTGQNTIAFFGRRGTQSGNAPSAGEAVVTPTNAVQVEGLRGNPTFPSPFTRVDWLQQVTLAGRVEYVSRGATAFGVPSENANQQRIYTYNAPAGLPNGNYRVIGVDPRGCGLVIQMSIP